MDFLSTKVKAFPISLRTFDGMGKYTTENNLTGIPRSVTDFDSFLLSRHKSDDPFRFVIHGYYFELTPDGDVPFHNRQEADVRDANLYIHIKIENNGEYSRLVDYDDGGTDIDNDLQGDWQFRALAIDTEPNPTGDANYTIYTLKLTNEDGDLAPESFIRDLPDSIGDRDGNSVGCFERATDGRLGFSKPIYLKAIGGFKVTNAVFWGSTAPTPTCTIPVTTEHTTATLTAEVGDIFFKL